MKKALLSGLALAFALPATTAWSQTTSDGIGTNLDNGESAVPEDAVGDAEDILALSEYVPRFYQVSARAWAIKVPGALIGAFFDAHTDMWTDGVQNFAYGVEFTTRMPDKYDLVLSLDWANLKTPDGFWLEADDPLRDAEYADNNLSALTLDTSFHWHNSLDRQGNVQLYYGLGLGVLVFLGDFTKDDVDTQACEFDEDDRNSTNVGLLDRCFDDQGSPFITATNEAQNIPPVLPSISATLGLRFLIADSLAISLEGGWKSIYAYGGIELGYFWEAQPRNRD
ncbi:MAG: hypothetical protein ACJAYU_003751 [Bradymonadia bacterium]|jgi:hypothetical protein